MKQDNRWMNCIEASNIALCLILHNNKKDKLPPCQEQTARILRAICFSQNLYVPLQRNEQTNYL